MAQVASVASDSELEREKVKDMTSTSSKQQKDTSPQPDEDAANDQGVEEEDDEEGDEEEPEYEIEAILEAKRGAFPGGRMGYLVKWKGYGEEDNSWVDEQDAGNAHKLIADFWEKSKKEKKSGRKSIDAKVNTATKATRKSIVVEDVSDVGSISVAKKRGRLSKAKESVDSSDVEMEIINDEDEDRRKKRQRRKTADGRTTLGATKPTKHLSREAEDEDIQGEVVGDMKKYMNKPNWEKLVGTVDTVERSDDGKLFVYFTLSPSGERVREDSVLCGQRFPQKLLRFYESNLRWKQTEPMESS